MSRKSDDEWEYKFHCCRVCCSTLFIDKGRGVMGMKRFRCVHSPTLPDHRAQQVRANRITVRRGSPPPVPHTSGRYYQVAATALPGGNGKSYHVNQVQNTLTFPCSRQTLNTTFLPSLIVCATELNFIVSVTMPGKVKKASSTGNNCKMLLNLIDLIMDRDICLCKSLMRD